jgi:hypothetical protein
MMMKVYFVWVKLTQYTMSEEIITSRRVGVLHRGGPQPAQATDGGGVRAAVPALREDIQACPAR